MTGLGLALTWPTDVLLVDADRNPRQSLQVGYLRACPTQDRGLSGILRAHRERRDLAMALRDNTCDLPRTGRDHSAVSRRCVPGFSSLGSVDLFDGTWSHLVQVLSAASGDVVVDAGYVGRHGLPTELASSAERVAVVCRSSLTSLVAVHLYAPVLAEQVASDRLGLIVVGPGRPYGVAEISEQLGLPVWAQVAWEPSAADDLHEGHPLSIRWPTSSLARSYARASQRLGRAMAAARREVGAVHV